MSSAPNVPGAALYTRPGGCVAAIGAGRVASARPESSVESLVSSGRGTFRNLVEDQDLV